MTYIAPKGGFGVAFNQSELFYMRKVIARDLGEAGGWGKLLSVLDEAVTINGAKIKELEAQAAMLKGEPFE